MRVLRFLFTERSLMKNPLIDIPDYERRITCYVLIVPSTLEVFGPFESEDDATLWVVGQLPSRMLFETRPVFDRWTR